MQIGSNVLHFLFSLRKILPTFNYAKTIQISFDYCFYMYKFFKVEGWNILYLAGLA